MSAWFYNPVKRPSTNGVLSHCVTRSATRKNRLLAAGLGLAVPPRTRPRRHCCQSRGRCENERCPGAHAVHCHPTLERYHGRGRAEDRRQRRDSSLMTVGRPPVSPLAPVAPTQESPDADGEGGGAREQGAASGGSGGAEHQPAGLLPAEGRDAAPAWAPLWVCWQQYPPRVDGDIHARSRV